MLGRFRILALSVCSAIAASGAVAAPAYGDLIPSPDYREWVFMSAGLDMSYSQSAIAKAMGHSVFDNVFVDPAAWAAFKQTGHWPDKATFVLEIRRAESHGSINKNGQFQTEELVGVEAHVHDAARFKGGWGFFQFDGPGPAKLVPYEAECYSCHQAHGAVDTTFTQFYPTAKPIAVKAGTFKEQ
jgi:hypothetical protein